MSLAVPAFADLTKATRAVLYGDAQGEGAFLAGGVAKLSATTATADGVALNLAASVADGAVSPSVTAMFSPSKATMLMAILGPGSSLTGARHAYVGAWACMHVRVRQTHKRLLLLCVLLPHPHTAQAPSPKAAWRACRACRPR